MNVLQSEKIVRNMGFMYSIFGLNFERPILPFYYQIKHFLENLNSVNGIK